MQPGKRPTLAPPRTGTGSRSGWPPRPTPCVPGAGLVVRRCGRKTLRCRLTEAGSRGSVMKVTVAICTWNRAKLLDQTLTGMRDLRVPTGVEWQLLVVNNNSPDQTDAVIERHSRQLPVRRLFE